MEFTIDLVDAVTSAAKAITGSLGGMTDAMGATEAATTALDAVVPGLGEAVAVATKITLGLAAAFVGVAAAGAALALQQNALEKQLTATFDALGGAGAGKATLAMLDELSEKLPQTREALAGWTKQFMALGVTGVEQLAKLNTAAASAQAIMGDPGAADAFITLEKKIRLAAESGQALKIPVKGLGSLAAAGADFDDIAKRMGVSSAVLGAQLKSGAVDAKKFGVALQEDLIARGAGPLANMGASLSTQWDKFKESIVGAFRDVDTGPFLGAVKDLFSIFSKSTPTGQAFKSFIVASFQKLFDVATKVIPIVKHFFLDLVILGLKAYIALKPFIAKFQEFLPYLAPVWTGIKIIGAVLGIVVVAAVASLAAFVGAFIALGVAALELVGIIGEFASDAWDYLSDLAGKVADIFSSGATIAEDFVQGLIDGITGGVAKAVAAAENLASSALDGVKGILGISSPSKVMAEMGGHTATGFAQGVEQAAPKAQGAMADLVAPPSGGGGGRSASGSSGGPAPNVTITINGVQGAEELKSVLPHLMAQAFEQLALQAGV